MNRYLREQIEPVCKFGPGGDFVSFWPAEPVKPTQAAALTLVAGSSLHIHGQPLLFPDDCRNKLRAGRKPRHIFRVYNRTDKKRPIPNLAEQDLLFEAAFKNAKTA